MDLGMSGYQLLGGVAASYAGDAPVDNGVVVVETSGTILYQFPMPVHAEVIAFGVNITVDFTVTATDAVVRLGKRRGGLAGTLTVLKDLTLGNSNAAGLTRGNGDRNDTVEYPKDNQVALAADSDLDAGDVVYADLSTLDPSEPLLNYHLWPGDILEIEHETAATAGGTGEYVPWVLVKISGPDFTQDNTWRELRSGESVLD